MKCAFYVILERIKMSCDEVDYSTFESKPKSVTTIHYVTQEKADRLVKESYIKALDDVTKYLVNLEIADGFRRSFQASVAVINFKYEHIGKQVS